MKGSCKHEGCSCEAQADGYCSDSCRQGKTAQGQCGCGHPDCR